MPTSRYVALLRGINVGGRNRIEMADLRAVFEAGGYGDVGTYIQTGNVLFSSEVPGSSLEVDLEARLEAAFGVPLVVVVRSHRQLRAVVEKAPGGFGDEPDRYHSDVLFLRSPLSSRRVMEVVERKEGVDRAWPGTGVLYFDRLSARRTSSRLGRITATPEYKRMTIRSWSTTTRLLAMLDERRASGPPG